MSKAYSDPVCRAITYKFFVRGRPYPKLARREAVATAIALHKRMYTAFAEYVIIAYPLPIESFNSYPTETTSVLYLTSVLKAY